MQTFAVNFLLLLIARSFKVLSFIYVFMINKLERAKSNLLLK